MSIPTIAPAVLDRVTNSAHSRRLLSIDLLRGLTIGFMIIVNDNGSETGAYWALKHSAWNGFTPTDLVFPTFLLLVGLSVVLSTASRLENGASKISLFFHVVRRTIILFLLGMVVNNYPFFHLATMRYYGVLPRIAVCYFIVATFYIFSPGWRSKVAALVGTLLGYWMLMRFVHVPGYGVPGRDIPLLDHDANLVAWLDRQIFSAGHLYEKTRDPEGLLSTIPALGTTLIGLLTGLWLRTQRTLAEKARGILIAGVSGLLLGGLWNFSFPINKKLWTSSYVLYAAGWSLLLLAFFIWFSDLRNSSNPQKATPQKSLFDITLLVFGTNAIAAYELSEVLASTLASIHLHNGLSLSHWIFQAIHSVVPGVAFASLLFSIAYVGVCWFVVYFTLYKQKIFIKI